MANSFTVTTLARETSKVLCRDSMVERGRSFSGPLARPVEPVARPVPRAHSLSSLALPRSLRSVHDGSSSASSSSLDELVPRHQVVFMCPDTDYQPSSSINSLFSYDQGDQWEAATVAAPLHTLDLVDMNDSQLQKALLKAEKRRQAGTPHVAGLSRLALSSK